MNLNQTLQEKYPHLEVSVLALSEVQKDNESFRIDSEPFKKSNSHINTNFLYEKLSNIALINPSKTEINNYSKNTFITFLSMQNLGSGFIHHREQGRIAEFENGYTYFAENDILIAKITPCMEHGKCAIATGLYNGIGFGSTEFNVFRIRDSRFLTEFVFCYLNRDSIRKIATDNMVGTSGRQRVPTAFYERLLIPIFPLEFQLEIQNLVKDSHKALEESKALYKKAEETLYLELGLDPKNPLQSLLDSACHFEPLGEESRCFSNAQLNISIRTLKESFLKTGRLDSEYYQSKYEDIEKFIKSYPNGYDSFSNIISNKDSNFTPKNNENYNYIELANIGNNGNINAPISDLGKNLPTRARRMVSKGDIIISSIEGSLSSCALITQEFDKHLVSTGFFVLNSKLLNGETLLVMFKSQIFQEYLKKFPSGTILCAINKEELSNILIPKIDSITQEKIANHIRKSFKLRTEAKALLEDAKAQVEFAINRGGD
ncbi:restriction endonuclease subunit S [Campylobacter armoricus]|uniref:restriction endonuclease subunit S n=1 Tax=Campylobacter armoricus TaxID=2505970 RepID=UPI001116C15A|nr:restriction endonuclease subunit S [Campylobacter armoricus]